MNSKGQTDRSSSEFGRAKIFFISPYSRLNIKTMFLLIIWGHSGVLVSALDFRDEGR